MDTAAWIAAVAKMRKLVGVYLALGGKLNARQAAALNTDLGTLDRDLAGLSESLQAVAFMGINHAEVPAAAQGDPMLVPTEANAGGQLVSKAAVMDAASIAAQNAGEPATPGAAQYAGQALREHFNGVEATGTGESITFTIFVNGSVVAIEHGTGATDEQALGQKYGVPA